MNDLLDRFRARVRRMTAQRQVVAETLQGKNVHLTADEVHLRAIRLRPEISRATVYNTLNELVAMGEVAEVVPLGRANRYDPNVVHRHHHLHCTGCGALEDVHVVNVDKIGLGPGVGGFQVDGIDIGFSGVCRACSSSS